jgi:hypothetical protein
MRRAEVMAHVREQARSAAIQSIDCAHCVNYAWTYEMQPVLLKPRFGDAKYHHPACPLAYSLAMPKRR